jgi:hypothetical protein
MTYTLVAEAAPEPAEDGASRRQPRKGPNQAAAP